jgi:hypothetical protein
MVSILGFFNSGDVGKVDDDEYELDAEKCGILWSAYATFN